MRWESLPILSYTNNIIWFATLPLAYNIHTDRNINLQITFLHLQNIKHFFWNLQPMSQAMWLWFFSSWKLCFKLENTSGDMRMLSDLQLVFMVPRNSIQLLNINTTKFQVERQPVYCKHIFWFWLLIGRTPDWVSRQCFNPTKEI